MQPRNLEDIFYALQGRFVKADVGNKRAIQEQFFLIASLLPTGLPEDLKAAQGTVSEIILKCKGKERMLKLAQYKTFTAALITYAKRILQIDETCAIAKGDIFKRYISNDCDVAERNSLERHLLICDKCLRRLNYCHEVITRINEQSHYDQLYLQNDFTNDLYEPPINLSEVVSVIDLNLYKAARKKKLSRASQVPVLKFAALTAKPSRKRKISPAVPKAISQNDIAPDLYDASSAVKGQQTNSGERIFSINGVTYLTAEILRSGDGEIALCGILGGDGSAFLRFQEKAGYDYVRIGGREFRLEAQDQDRTIIKIVGFTLKEIMTFLNE